MKHVDVLILGGGPSGVAAAVGAARRGASVLLVEREFSLGGTATGALVNPLQTFHAPSGRVIGGAAQEMIEALAARGATPGHLPDPIGFATSVTPVDPDALKIFLAEWMKELKVRVLLGHAIKGADVAGDGVRSVAIEDQQGNVIDVSAKCYVDASGNGDLTAAAGIEMEIDDNCQPMTLIFIMDRVDARAVINYQKNNPDEFFLPKDASVLDRGYLGVSGFFTKVRAARDAGRLNVMRDRLLFFGTARKGEALVNTTRVTGLNALSGEQLSEGTRVALAQVDELVRFMQDEIPGFERARLTRIADRIGVRETRRLLGRYVMDERDVRANARFEDVIAKGAFPMDMHSADGDGLNAVFLDGKGFYDVPFRSLLNRSVANLITVGRCISVTHEGFSSTRVMPTCMAIGQAGGVAAALLAETGKDFETLTARVQDTLIGQGAIVFDENVIAEKPG